MMPDSLKIEKRLVEHVKSKLDDAKLSRPAATRDTPWHVSLKSQEDWNTYWTTALNGARARARPKSSKASIPLLDIDSLLSANSDITSVEDANKLAQNNTELADSLRSAFSDCLKERKSRHHKERRSAPSSPVLSRKAPRGPTKATDKDSHRSNSSQPAEDDEEEEEEEEQEEGDPEAKPSSESPKLPDSPDSSSPLPNPRSLRLEGGEEFLHRAYALFNRADRGASAETLRRADTCRVGTCYCRLAAYFHGAIAEDALEGHAGAIHD